MIIKYTKIILMLLVFSIYLTCLICGCENEEAKSQVKPIAEFKTKDTVIKVLKVLKSWQWNDIS